MIVPFGNSMNTPVNVLKDNAQEASNIIRKSAPRQTARSKHNKTIRKRKEDISVFSIAISRKEIHNFFYGLSQCLQDHK